MRKILLLLVSISLLWSWEVNTHHALTLEALRVEARKENPQNLQNFIDKFNLSKQNYKDEIFEDVGIVESYT